MYKRQDVLRLIEVFTERGLYVGSVCITRYAGQESADLFKNRLEKLGIRVFVHYNIPGLSLIHILPASWTI